MSCTHMDVQTATMARRPRTNPFFSATRREMHSQGRAQYLEDCVFRPLFRHLPLFFPAQSSTPPSLPTGYAGRWPDLVKHIWGSPYADSEPRSQKRILQKTPCDGKGVGGGERQWKYERAETDGEREKDREIERQVRRVNIHISLSFFPTRTVLLPFFRYVHSRNVVYSHRGWASLSPLNTSLFFFLFFSVLEASFIRAPRSRENIECA